MVSDWLNTREIIDKTVKKPCHRLGWCPYGKLVEAFPIREKNSSLTCMVFHHDCPVFYHIEDASEEYNQDDYEKEIDILFKNGGLNEVFSKDKISEYWYKMGSIHSDDDSKLKLEYSIEKVTEEYPKNKEILQKLKNVFLSVPLEEIYRWNSQK